MATYILRRLLYFIPTLLAISLLTFFISINAPGDPVELMLNRSGGDGGQNSRNSAGDKDYANLRHKLGFDLPLFYFSISDATVPDTLHKVTKKEHRNALKRLSNTWGNWENVSKYYRSIQLLQANLFTIEADSTNKNNLESSKNIIAELLQLQDSAKISKSILLLTQLSPPLQNLKINSDYATLESNFNILTSKKDPYQKYIPRIHWYAFNNQYHHWIINFLKGDFGISYQDKQPVKTMLSGALVKTVGISLLSIVLAYCIAIPLGVQAAIHKGTSKEKSITTTLFILYSLPNFWIATMLVIFLCGGDYFSWFPGPGAPPIPDDAPLLYKITQGIYVLILPLFCWTYGSLAFISRQMRGGILASISQDYIQTARAKGLNETQVVWKHAMKNSLLPIITLFASIFPLAISGAFVIESVFNIPGMGKLSLEALYARDYPVIFTVMMITAILTMLGNLIADLLYALVDPRISYTK